MKYQSSIDKENLENIDKDILEDIDINKVILENINMHIDIAKDILGRKINFSAGLKLF